MEPRISVTLIYCSGIEETYEDVANYNTENSLYSFVHKGIRYGIPFNLVKEVALHES